MVPWGWIRDHGAVVQVKIGRLLIRCGKMGRGRRKIDSKNVSLDDYD